MENEGGEKKKNNKKGIEIDRKVELLERVTRFDTTQFTTG